MSKARRNQNGRAALGSTEGLSLFLKRALDPGDDFDPLPEPLSGDWLACHPEPGQTFDEFVKVHICRPGKIRKKLYLRPLGAFDPEHSPSLELLRDYAQAALVMETEVLPLVSFQTLCATCRINAFTGRRQVLTIDILRHLALNKPEDAFCILGITMEDLYPAPGWNFVFGQASMAERVGVYSFVRYDPTFYGQTRGEGYKMLMLKRSCKVLLHETAHMFGLAHCIYYHCVLNGSNHLKESDARPMHLCPVCLRKIQHSIGFDILEHYRRLLAFYTKTGFNEDAAWTSRRLERIMEGP